LNGLLYYYQQFFIKQAIQQNSIGNLSEAEKTGNFGDLSSREFGMLENIQEDEL
jgi:hypothetical protein